MKTARFLAALFLLAEAGCTQERLQPPKKETRAAVDNLVTVDADFCTQKPEDAIFPVKIMLILDASGSLQFLDEGGLRVSAIRQLLSRYDGDPTVSFNIIQFNSLLYQFPPDGTFTNPVDITDGQLQVAEVLTDYQAALSKAYATLLQDMTRSGGLVQNTKYVVIFFSDGSPSPVCCPCEDETTSYQGTQHFTCDNEGNPDPPAPVLQVGTQVFQQRFCETVLEIPLCNLELDRTGRAVDAYPGLNVNGNYNRSYQIDQLLRDIVDLATTFEAGSFQFHTVFFNNPNLPQAIRDLVAIDEVASRERMSSMAALGGGNFIEAKSPQELNFLQFDFTAIKRAFGLRRVLVTNLNSVPGKDGPLPDSDGDGLSDEQETREGISNFLKKDTDGDGYGDLLETRMSDRGLNAKNPSVPFEPCPMADRVDIDHDLLNACEERFLGTDPQLPDTDYDTIPDGLELRFGLNPLEADADLDYDFDGVSNGEEINNGTDPRLDDPTARDRASIRYRLKDTGETLDRRTCFGVSARNIQLQYTQGRDGSNEPGWNDLYLWELESPESNGAQDVRMREACFRARYLPPDFKDPVTGTYRRLKDDELKSVYDPEVLDKCWGPQLGTGVVGP
jgi:hypothetical protein